MIIGTCKVYFIIPWAESLKDKRMVVKSLIEKMKNKFNISVAEIEDQDIIKSAVIGFACVTNERSHADSIISNVLNYIEEITDAQIIDILTEIL